LVEGTDYRQMAPRELRRKLGLVTQRPYLFPGSVADNLRFGPAQRGQTLQPEAIAELLSQVGLKDYAGRDVANLSGGEAQRVSVARTLANAPLALLLDEPTSALDEGAKLEVESAIQKVVRDQGLTCVLVTHEVAQAARLASRALVLERGRVVRTGPVGEVLRAYARSPLDQRPVVGRNDRGCGRHLGAARQGHAGRVSRLGLGHRLRRGFDHRADDVAGSD
jgi:putative ABC transport system ATP-binding protein